MRPGFLATLLPLFFASTAVIAQSPDAEPPETGVPVDATPDVTFPSTDAFIFCSAPDCSGTCQTVLFTDTKSKDGNVVPGDMGYQSMYWYDPQGYGDSILLYTCLNDCLVINPVQITETDTCYNLLNNSIPTDFYIFYYLIDSTG